MSLIYLTKVTNKVITVVSIGRMLERDSSGVGSNPISGLINQSTKLLFMRTWTKHVSDLFVPFRRMNVGGLVLLQVIFTLLIWVTSHTTYVPSLLGIMKEMYIMIKSQSLITHFLISIWLCLQAILLASAVGLVFAYLSVLPFFKGISEFATKLRFLAATGFGFLFMRLSHDVQEQKLLLMTFAIVGFLVASMVSTIKEIPQEKIDYCKVTGLNRWQMFRELVVFGKAYDLYECIRQNFAIAWSMLAMVENLAKSEGGIGVLMSDKNRLFNFEGVYAIQLLILLTGILIDYILRVGSKYIFTYKN